MSKESIIIGTNTNAFKVKNKDRFDIIDEFGIILGSDKDPLKAIQKASAKVNKQC